MLQNCKKSHNITIGAVIAPGVIPLVDKNASEATGSLAWVLLGPGQSNPIRSHSSFCLRPSISGFHKDQMYWINQYSFDQENYITPEVKNKAN